MIRAVILLLLAMGIQNPSIGADFEGSRDHPVLTRYPGSEIKWYDVQAFEHYAVALGPIVGFTGIEEWEEIEGRTTRIYYELEGEKTHTEVFLNYTKALKEAGFENLANGSFIQSSRVNDIGSRKWLGEHYKRNQPPPVGIRLLSGSSTSGGTGYLAMKKERPAGTIYVVIGISQYSQNIVATMIDVIEIENAVTDLITVNAEAISDRISEFGRIILDGLFFDHDQATLTPASNTALTEIANYLNAHPDMRFYVVGHTDAVGAYTYNQTLSAQRAAAVVKELVDNYGIEVQRLDPHGVGPLMPVFSNSSDAGRGKNRRVELVEKP